PVSDAVRNGRHRRYDDDRDLAFSRAAPSHGSQGTSLRKRDAASGQRPRALLGEVLSRCRAVHSVRHRNRLSHPLGDDLPGEWRIRLRLDRVPPRGDARLPADLVRWVYLRLETRCISMGLTALSNGIEQLRRAMAAGRDVLFHGFARRLCLTILLDEVEVL